MMPGQQPMPSAPGFAYHPPQDPNSKVNGADLPVGQPVIPDVPSIPPANNGPPVNNGQGAPQGGNPADLADLEARLKALDGL